MKQDFFHSLQDQLERAGDSGEPPRKQRWRALRRWLRALRRRRVRVATVVGVGVLIALGAAASLDRSVLPAAVRQATSAVAAGQPASGKYASDVTTTSTSTVAPSESSPAGAQSGAGTGAAVDTETVSAGSPVSLSFSPRSVTAISEYEWWILGKSVCAATSCNTIVRTTSGGYSFVQIQAPAAATVSGLRFADQLDGYLYGSQLWSTHDGGEHWRQVHIAGQIRQLATAGGYVFAVIDNSRGGVLWRSPIGVDRWQRVPAAGHAQSLWVQGQSVLVDSRSDSTTVARLRYSSDNGSSFRVGAKNPGGSDAFVCNYDETLDGTIWALCGGGGAVTAYRSVDHGSSFKSAGGAGTVRSMQSPTLAAASSAVAVAGDDASGDGTDGGGALLRTSDGGKSWYAAELTGLAAGSRLLRVSYLGFTDATHGVAIIELRVPVTGASGTASAVDSWRLYYTTDGGASYHYVPISG